MDGRNNEKEKPKAGPSGMTKDVHEEPSDADKRKTRPILKQKKPNKKAKKVQISQERERRRSSSVAQQTLRYRVPARVEGHQRSHTVRKLLPLSRKDEEKPSRASNEVNGFLLRLIR